MHGFFVTADSERTGAATQRRRMFLWYVLRVRWLEGQDGEAENKRSVADESDSIVGKIVDIVILIVSLG
jgi:hypothetical protein